MKSAKFLDAQEIPIIDIGLLQQESDIESVGRDLIWAATEVGFIYVKNHGIPEDLIASARAAGLAFFRLDDSEKSEVMINEYHHGYLKTGATKMHEKARTDLKEGFTWGAELDAESLEEEADNPMIGPNRWPGAMPGLKDSIYPYFEAASQVAENVLRAFASASSLPEDFFLRCSNRPVSRGSLQYYPPQESEAGEARYGLGAHTDFGVLTVLCQDDVGGLELQMLNGEWRSVPPIPGTLVINVGDLLERWSNGHFRSTPHRVVNNSGRERLSLVIAYDPNYETIVESRTFCSSEENPKWEDTRVGDYLMWRFKRAFAYRETMQD